MRKCCVPGCKNTRQDALLHKFPTCENRRKIWLDSVNCAPLRALKVYELEKKWVCHKHFEARFLTQKSRLLMQAYPTLFTEHETSTGVPTHSNSENQNPSIELEHTYCRTLHVDHNYAACRPTESVPLRAPLENTKINIIQQALSAASVSCASASAVEIVEEPRVVADAGDSGPVQEPRDDNTDICDGGDNVDDDHSDTLVESNVDNTNICDGGDNVDDDDSDTLVESNVCRVCLALDVKMYDLKDNELRETFQNITGIEVTENNHPILERLCWECAGRLKAAAAFRKKALLSDALLQRLANTGEQIRKHYITLIKENVDYLKSAATLSIVEVFNTVEIDTDNESLSSISDNNDTKMEQNILEDSIELKESIIKEDNDEMDVEEESMNEAPIKTDIEYDSIYPNTGEENINIVLETNSRGSNNIPLREETINSGYSSPLPGCSHVEPKYTILGYLAKTPREDKRKKKVKITNRDSTPKIVSKKSKKIISHGLKGDAKLKKMKVGGISKKASNQILVKNTEVKENINAIVEYLNLEDIEF